MKKSRFILFIAFICIPFILFSQNIEITKGENGMATAASPLASKVAIQILQEGGNAIDAAVAAAFVIGVVEPDGSGIGGGGGMMVYLKDTQQSFYINFYIKSPEKTALHYDRNKRHSGESICIPGSVAGLTMALENFGTLPLSKVMAPAIKLAQEGFPIDATLGSLILDNSETLGIDPETAKIYLEDGFPKMEGDLLVQTDLAKTLTEISKKGRDGFYKGWVAKSIVEGVNERGGKMSLKDLSNFEAILSEPLHGTYRNYEILSTDMPQSGGSIIEGLNILENVNLKKLGHYTENAQTLHIMAETFRKIYTDRYYFVGDPKFVDIPTDGIISKAFAKNRFDAINLNVPEPLSYRATQPGNPYLFENTKAPEVKQKKQFDFGDDDSESTFSTEKEADPFDSWGKNNSSSRKPKTKKLKKVKTKKKEKSKSSKEPFLDVEYDGSTTHISVIDKDGNAVALTQTLGTFFGSAQTISGVLLNCGMSNFSSSDNPNILKRNKQPRSSISPTIVLKDHKPYLIIGSPGGNRIISTVLQVIVNVLDFNMNVEEANRAPRFYTQKWEDYLFLESNIGEDIINQLKEMGHKTRVYQGADLFFGGVHMIIVDPLTGEYSGSADIRRGGKAIAY